jgi:hypothetical protein
MRELSATGFRKLPAMILSCFSVAVIAVVVSGSSEGRSGSVTEKGSDFVFGSPTSTTQISGCGYNVKTCRSATSYHTGIDYSKSSSSTTNVVASNYGQVAYVESMSSSDHGMGNNLIIEHELVSGAKIYSSYSHLASIAAGLKVGTPVVKGQTLGTMGGSGYGKANYWETHLHFEIKDKAVTNNPSGSGLYWGYTPSNPDSYGYHNPTSYIGSASVKPPVTVMLTSPNSGAFTRGYSVSVSWSTTGASSSDKISISLKRDSYASLSYPDGVNFIRFTESEYNDGSYRASIPISAATASDWRFYVKHNTSGKYDTSDSTITISR